MTTTRWVAAPKDRGVLSNLRDVAVFLDASKRGEAAGRHAAALAKRHGAHLVGVFGVSRERALHHASGYVRGGAIRHLIHQQRLQDEKHALIAGRWFGELVDEFGVSSEFRVVWHDGPLGDSVLRALHCDLIVATHPKPAHLPASWSAEELLLTTGIPTLLLPEDWPGGEIGAHVMIAWNRSREARRAVADAMAFIAGAGHVTILVVDADRDPDHFGDNPGENILQHVSRHNANVELACVSSEGASIASVILEQARHRQVDLTVIGAYSRPRSTEVMFGGVTRSLLTLTRSPLLISR